MIGKFAWGLARLFVAASLMVGTASHAQYRSQLPAHPLEDEWRKLVAADWAQFTIAPESFTFDGDGHGGFAFNGQLKERPFANGREVARIEGILFLQCPTRRAAIAGLRFYDADRDPFVIQVSDRARLKFFYGKPGGWIDELVEQTCATSHAWLPSGMRDLGYRPTPPALGIEAMRGVSLGAPIPASIPACGEMTPARHAELLAQSSRCSAETRSPRNTVLVMSPEAVHDRAWSNVGALTVQDDRVSAARFYVDPALLDEQMTRMVAEFGLPSEVRSRLDSRVSGGRTRTFTWVGKSQVVTLVDREYFPQTRAVLSVTGFTTRASWERR